MSHTGHFELFNFKLEISNFYVYSSNVSHWALWALTEGQYRPKAGKKKKTREAGLFFLVWELSKTSCKNEMQRGKDPLKAR